MRFPLPLVPGTLLRRYKRFLADVRLDDGTEVTAHTANSGSMTGVCDPGSRVWLSPADAPGRKLKWTWEIVEAGGHLVGINTNTPNVIAAEAIAAGAIPELAGYATLRREVRYGGNSRIDLLLEDPDRPRCWVEVKNVTLFGDGCALFPDAVTARGAKHLVAMAERVAAGERAVMLYVVQRAAGECTRFAVAEAIDPAYAAGLRTALASGVEAICYTSVVRPDSISLAGPLPLAPHLAAAAPVRPTTATPAAPAPA